MKKVKSSLLVVVILLAIALAGFVRADSMEQYCNTFKDYWFKTVTFDNDGYICESISPFLSKQGIQFSAEMSVRFPDELTTIEEIDFTVQTPFVGVELGTKNLFDNNNQFTFVPIQLGDYATAQSRHTWVRGWNTDGQEDGKQNSLIVYAMRVGFCSGSVRVSGEGPWGSRSYGDILADQVEREARLLTEKMQKIVICGSNITVAPTPPPAPGQGQSSPSSPTISPTPEVDARTKFNERLREQAEKIAEKLKEITKCSGSGLPSQNACVAGALDKIPIYIDENKDVISAGGYFGPTTKRSLLQPVREIPQFIIDMIIPEKGRAPTDMERINLMLERATGQIQKEFDASYFGPKAKSMLAGLQIAPATPTSYQNLVVLDADVTAESKIIFEPQMPVVGEWKPLTGGAEVAPNSLIVTDQKSVRLGSGTTVVEIGPGSGIVVGSFDANTAQSVDLKFGTIKVEKIDDSQEIEVQTPLSITKSKHTQFAVLYDPGNQYSATAIYEGEVEVTDRFTGETATLTPADDGKPRVLIVPLAQAQDSSAFIPIVEPESKSSAWLYIVTLLALLGGAGFWLYEKKFKINHTV